MEARSRKRERLNIHATAYCLRFRYNSFTNAIKLFFPTLQARWWNYTFLLKRLFWFVFVQYGKMQKPSKTICVASVLLPIFLYGIHLAAFPPSLPKEAWGKNMGRRLNIPWTSLFCRERMNWNEPEVSEEPGEKERMVVEGAKQQVLQNNNSFDESVPLGEWESWSGVLERLHHCVLSFHFLPRPRARRGRYWMESRSNCDQKQWSTRDRKKSDEFTTSRWHDF